MSGKLTPVYLLAGLFIILSPLSMATGLDGHQSAKYLRLLTTVAIVLVGLVSAGGFQIGPASKALLVFAAIWVASAGWSDLPHWALFYKGMFALTLVSGIALGATPRRLGDVEKGMRFLAIVSLFAALIVVVAYLRNPTGAMQHDRLAIWGMNANLIAQTAAPLSVFCVFLAVNDRRRSWKMLATGALALIVIVMLLTGSRGGVGMALVGCGLVLVPYGKRPAIVLVSIGFIGAIGYIALELLAESDTVRLIDELTKNTRSGIWGFAIRRFESSPIIGHGWLHYGSNWAGVQGAYLQVLAEAGLVGSAVLAITLLVIAQRWFTVKSRLSRHAMGYKYSYLCAGMIAAPLMHGMAESSLVMGTTLNPLLLGMGVSLIDRLPSLMRGADLAVQSRRYRFATAVAQPQPVSEQPAIAFGGNAGNSDLANRFIRRQSRGQG